MRILQLSPAIQEYHAVFYDDEPEDDSDESVFYLPVPQFGIAEIKKGAISSGPLILVKDREGGALVPAWTLSGYIGCAPVEDNDDQHWLEVYREQQEEETGRRDGRSSSAGKKPKKAKASPRRVDDEQQQPDGADDADEEEDEDDDEPPEGEVQLSGKRR